VRILVIWVFARIRRRSRLTGTEIMTKAVT